MSVPDNSSLPVFEAKTDAAYSLDVVCELTGLNSQTVTHYREIGLISSPADAGASFSDETIRTLRRIEHLRTDFEMTETALKLTLGLMNEVERLRDELRSRR